MSHRSFRDVFCGLGRDALLQEGEARGRGQGHSRRRVIGTAGEGRGLGTHVVLACPTCLQVLGVFTPSASWRLLSPTCYVSLHDAELHAKKALIRIARKARGNCAARWNRNT